MHGERWNSLRLFEPQKNLLISEKTKNQLTIFSLPFKTRFVAIMSLFFENFTYHKMSRVKSTNAVLPFFPWTFLIIYEITYIRNEPNKKKMDCDLISCGIDRVYGVFVHWNIVMDVSPLTIAKMWFNASREWIMLKKFEHLATKDILLPRTKHVNAYHTRM